MASRDPYPVREYRKGIACLEAHDYAESCDHLSRSLAADPAQPEAQFARARALAAMGEYLTAIEDLKEVVKTDDNGAKLALLAYCCNCLKSHPEAGDLYMHAIEKGFRSAAVYNNLGYTRYKQGFLPSAVKALNAAVAIDSAQTRILHNRAIVHYAVAAKLECLPSEAMKDIESVLVLGDVSGDVYCSAAAIFAYAASIDESHRVQALMYLRLAIQHGTSLNSIESDVTLAQLYHLSGDIQAVQSENGIGTSVVDVRRFVNPLD